VGEVVSALQGVPFDMGVSILLVDDQRDIRKFASMTLAMKGFHVIEAENGHQAIECLTSNSVDLVITDWNMPQMSGYEMLQCFNEQQCYRAIPVVVLSALQRPQESDLPNNHNIFYWLRKPCLISSIHSAVTDVLDYASVAVN